MILTAKRKAIYLPQLVNRDGGFKCFYCKKDLVGYIWVYEHLDNNPNHSEVENIVLAHQSCNVKKKNDCDMQIMAMEKVRLNHQMNLSCERENMETDGPTTSPEMDVSQKNFELVKKYLHEIISTDGYIEVKDAIDSSSMYCQNKTNHGSPVAIRRYIDMLCSREGSFMYSKNDDGKRILVIRSGK